MAELHGMRFTAMFTADADQQIRFGGTAGFHGHSHQLAHSPTVQDNERIFLENLAFQIGLHEFAFRIVPAETERGLGQIVGAEAEEIGDFGQFAGQQGGAWHFDH